MTVWDRQLMTKWGAEEARTLAACWITCCCVRHYESGTLNLIFDYDYLYFYLMIKCKCNLVTNTLQFILRWPDWLEMTAVWRMNSVSSESVSVTFWPLNQEVLWSQLSTRKWGNPPVQQRLCSNSGAASCEACFCRPITSHLLSQFEDSPKRQH